VRPAIGDIRRNPKIGRLVNSRNADDTAIVICVAKLAFADHARAMLSILMKRRMLGPKNCGE